MFAKFTRHAAIEIVINYRVLSAKLINKKKGMRFFFFKVRLSQIIKEMGRAGSNPVNCNPSGSIRTFFFLFIFFQVGRRTKDKRTRVLGAQEQRDKERVRVWVLVLKERVRVFE